MTTDNGQKPRTSRWAIAGVVLGILSAYRLLLLLPPHHQFRFLFIRFPWIFWGAPLAFCAMFFGALGLNRIRTSKGRLSGRSIGITGILLGCLSIVFAVFIAAHGFIEARSYSNIAQDTGEIECEYADSLSTQVYDHFVSATVRSERMYYDNGQLGSETRYCLNNDMFHGKGGTWEPDGRLATEFYCLSNSIKMTLYYHDNSVTAHVTRWQENSEKCISDIRYFPDGRVKEAKFYNENGVCTGTYSLDNH